MLQSLEVFEKMIQIRQKTKLEHLLEHNLNLLNHQCCREIAKWYKKKCITWYYSSDHHIEDEIDQTNKELENWCKVENMNFKNNNNTDNTRFRRNKLHLNKSAKCNVFIDKNLKCCKFNHLTYKRKS